jgi:hypothetical protein
MSVTESLTAMCAVLKSFVEALNALSTNWMALTCIVIGAILIGHHPVEATGLVTGGFAILSHRQQ